MQPHPVRVELHMHMWEKVMVGININQCWQSPVARNRAACYALDMHSGVALAPHTAPYARVKLARQIR